jgi:tRNA(Ile)-lysidine synthetase-like protein
MSNLSNLLDFWFQDNKYQSFWFDCSKDKEIFDNYNPELTQAENKNFEEILFLDYQTKFYYLILFDQITRNVSRISNTDPYKNDDKALLLAQNLITNNYDITLPFIKRMFILLPFRHTEKINNLDFVISRLNMYHNNLQYKISEKSDYQRFYIATLKNYTVCTENISVLLFSNRDIIYEDTIHDENCKNYENIVSKNTVKDLEKNKLYQSILTYCRKYRIKRLGVSLSGGVDSMVLLFLLQQMVLRGDLEIVVAIHVDYNWRKESNQEAEYLFTFCSHIGVDFVLRDVKHFNAEVDKKIDIERELVEEETKQIRFNTYKYAIQKYNLAGICLGHHKDDLIENVFMNLSKGKNILDLFVTEEYSLQYDVNILRPMLNHQKPDIFDIAHQNNIIYFKDTTPDWSFRGTMRRKIFPTMENFDKMILGNFYRIGEQSSEWGKFIKNKIIKPILASAKTYKYGMSFELHIDFNDIPTAFWSELLVNFFHMKGIGMISQKNLHSFIEWINRDRSQETLFRLSNNHITFRNLNKIYFIKTDIYENLRSELLNKKYEQNIDFESTETFYLKAGLWNIEITNVRNLITQNNQISYEDILNGCFKYYVNSRKKDIIISNTEKNKSFREVSLLSHIIPKIKDDNVRENSNTIFVICKF